MAGIRTVMVTTPALVGELIERLAVGRIELDVVGQLNGRRALARQLRRLRPHLVIIGLHENETEKLIRALLAQLPNSKVVAVSHDCRSIAGYELRLSRMQLSNLSPADFINFIGANTTDSGA